MRERFADAFDPLAGDRLVEVVLRDVLDDGLCLAEPPARVALDRKFPDRTESREEPLDSPAHLVGHGSRERFVEAAQSKRVWIRAWTYSPEAAWSSDRRRDVSDHPACPEAADFPTQTSTGPRHLKAV